MASKGRRLELTCPVCKEALTTTDKSLSENAQAMLADQSVFRRANGYNDHECQRYNDVKKDQVVATKCGHLYHMGCLKDKVKENLKKNGSICCLVCNKPFSMTRLWPVLIPPTPYQADRFKKIEAMKKQNKELQADLKEIRKTIKEKEAELMAIQDETTRCLEEIKEKQNQLDELSGPTDEEIEELRRIHAKRQAIVRVVTKHNADLLEVLMHETNLQVSDDEDEDENERDQSKGTRISVNNNSTRLNSPNNSHARSTAFGVYTDSFQEMNGTSSGTFSERTAPHVPFNTAVVETVPSLDMDRVSNSQQRRTWEKVNSNFKNGVLPTHPESGRNWKCMGQNSFSIALERKEGTRGIGKKGSSRKKVYVPKPRPEWDPRLN